MDVIMNAIYGQKNSSPTPSPATTTSSTPANTPTTTSATTSATTSETTDKPATINQNFYNSLNELFLSPGAFITLLFIFVMFVGLYIYLGKSPDASGFFASYYSPSTPENGRFDKDEKTPIIFIVVAISLVILFVVSGMNYFYGSNVNASLKDFLSGTPKVDIKIQEPAPLPSLSTPTIPSLKPIQQVFNISDQKYTYDDANALCKAYGSRLATYEDLQDAYGKGASWCRMGWSDNQLALYPTSKDVYNQLQKIDGHEHDCGIPGVNGGYISNPNATFGVNCYGYKPVITQEEEEIMQTSSPYPQTEDDIIFDQKVNYYKTKIGDILISTFNYDQWNKI